MTDTERLLRQPRPPAITMRSAYFVSDSTGITAETLGNALLANFPDVAFQRRTVPFVDSISGARTVVGERGGVNHSTSRPASSG